MLIGYAANGLHTNGYTLARRILFKDEGLGVESEIPTMRTTVGEALLAVHRSYYRAVAPVLGQLHGLAHITGGGIPGNLSRSLPQGCRAAVEKGSWIVPLLFRYLQEAATGSGETSVDAKIVLLLFLRRERRYPEALEIARGLVPRYPHNLLMALEQGNLLRASGNNSEAASAYQKILQSGRDGLYPDLHYELAALSLGDLLRAQKDYAGAASAYEQVSQIQKPDPEVLQKANLGAGEMYDVLKKRELAIQKYQAVVATNVNTAPAETARKRMKEAYRQE